MSSLCGLMCFGTWHIRKGIFYFHHFGPYKRFLRQNGVKIHILEKSKKVPLDILEINIVAKFGPIPIKIVAGSLNTHIHTHNGHFSTPVYQYSNIPIYSTTNHPTYLPTIQTSTIPLYPSLMFCYQALRAENYKICLFSFKKGI